MLGVWTGDQSEVIEMTGGSLASAEAFMWVANVAFQPALGLLCLIPLFIPDGKLPSERWRPVARIFVVAVCVGTVAQMFRPGLLSESHFENPLGVDALKVPLDFLTNVIGSITPLFLFIAVASIAFRFRKATGLQRQQLKWLAFGAAAVMLDLLLLLVTGAMGVEDGTIAALLTVPAIVAIPVSLGIAMLRYRLYDIDVLVNKTLVYGSLTTLLTGSYLLIVVTLQRILDPVTQGSDVAIAGSTLAVAALFRPARGRLQRFIDRRFYRRKYDVAATLDQFSLHLRDEVDLDSLSHELVAVVGRTMQPAHLSLWLKKA
jgi:hypothetical protein